jgi:uncharacterized membrane protein
MHNDVLDDVLNAVSTNHPARPYLLSGAILGGLGLMRNSFSGILLLGIGAALVSRGVEEMRRVQGLHGGNHHGVNAPPANR